MSRGPGKVRRGVLSALERCGKLNTSELTREVFAMWGDSHLSSTRRALRALHRAGRVHCLGPDLGGENTWCLPEMRRVHEHLARGERVTPGELLGGGWIARALNSAR